MKSKNELLLEARKYQTMYDKAMHTLQILLEKEVTDFNEKLIDKDISIVPDIHNEGNYHYIKSGVGQISKEEFEKEMGL